MEKGKQPDGRRKTNTVQDKPPSRSLGKRWGRIFCKERTVRLKNVPESTTQVLQLWEIGGFQVNEDMSRRPGKSKCTREMKG